MSINGDSYIPSLHDYHSDMESTIPASNSSISDDAENIDVDNPTLSADLLDDTNNVMDTQFMETYLSANVPTIQEAPIEGTIVQRSGVATRSVSPSSVPDTSTSALDRQLSSPIRLPCGQEVDRMTVTVDAPGRYNATTLKTLSLGEHVDATYIMPEGQGVNLQIKYDFSPQSAEQYHQRWNTALSLMPRIMACAFYKSPKN